MKNTPLHSTSITAVRRPSLKINALSNWASLGVNIIIGFLLTPFIISNLGKTGYGIWTLVGSFIGYYGLLNLGVSSAVSRYIARYTAQKDEKSLNEVASTALLMFCITGVLAILLSLALAGVIADFFNVEPQQRQEFIRLIWIIGITTGISFPGNIFSAIVMAREHYVANNIITIIRALLRAALTVFFINIGWGLLGVGIAPLIATIFAVFSSFFLFKYYASDVRLRSTFANKQTFKILLIYGGTTTVVIIADLLRSSIDSIVIGKFVGLEAVGIYGIAIVLLRYINRLIRSAMSVLSPRFAHLDGAGKNNELRKLFLQSISISSLLSFGAGAMAILLGGNFILWWVGDDFRGALPVIIILAIGSSFALAQNPAIGLMYALNKHKFYAIVTIIEALANLILSLILVSRYGIIGVALGTFFSMIIVKVIVMPLYVTKVANVSLYDYCTPILFHFIIALSIICIVKYFEMKFYISPTISYIIVLGAAIGSIYIALSLYLSKKILKKNLYF